MPVAKVNSGERAGAQSAPLLSVLACTPRDSLLLGNPLGYSSPDPTRRGGEINDSRSNQGHRWMPVRDS